MVHAKKKTPRYVALIHGAAPCAAIQWSDMSSFWQESPTTAQFLHNLWLGSTVMDSVISELCYKGRAYPGSEFLVANTLAK